MKTERNPDSAAAPSPSDDALTAALAWKARGERAALATVVGTWGSSPCPPGSQLAVNETGTFVGSVSGGCVEGAVVEEALAIIEHGGTRLLEFGVDNERAWEVGLACGGRIRVFVERID
jgi:xanthine/CO dehydrogenase XdhC/CoxF family maturation factor